MLKDKCFVIMPFQVKGIPEEPGRTFDFDKIYRVLIRRAVLESGMEPIRADEQTGSHIIHSDMFKELRDRTVVLADLSLGNPNVYYELGIRHVLAPGGTVLICRKDTKLPFDVRLSRVIFYGYDGVNIDWEEVEDIVPRLKAALDKAKEQEPDSPVHAFLGRVFPEKREEFGRDSKHDIRRCDSGMNLLKYEQMVASIWREKKVTVNALINEHGASVFGARSLAELCLQTQPLGEEGAHIAQLLYNHAQYDLCCRLFERLREEESMPGAYMLTPDDLACFGSAVSERDLTIAGAEAGVLLVKKGLERSGQDATARQRLRLHNYLAGLYLWKWRLSNAPAALTESISHLRQATEIAEQMKTSGERRPLGRIAKVYLQLLVALRQQDGTCKRQDSEGCLNAIIALDESSAMDPRDASYLRWYKAIAYADSGLEDAVRETVLQTVQADVMISRQAKENTVEIGQKQYAVLRRFITDNLPFFKHQALLGYISQALQSASQHRWESPNS